jgi:flagellar hook assembly protein FlgD
MPIEGIVDNDYVNQITQATASKANTNANGFDPNMFLKILMSQLQNQSPFDSMDSQQIMEQQAMLTQVEQSTRMSGYMEEMKSSVEEELGSVRTSLQQINQTLLNISEKI